MTNTVGTPKSPSEAPRARGRPRLDAAGPAPAAAIKPAALRLFAEKGFDTASVRDIAAAAGVDVALISYQFGSKLGLWKAIVADLASYLFANLAEAAQDGSATTPIDALREGMAAYIDFALRHPEVPRFLLRGTSRAADHAQWLEDKLTRPFLSYFLPLMEAAQKAGQLRIACPEMALLHFAFGVSVAIARRDLMVSLSPPLTDAEAFRTALCETLIEPVLRHG